MTMDASQGLGAGATGEAPYVDAGQGPQAIGAYLRRQRELRGISAEELARATRIPLRSLERLEAGTFDGEVDGFVRGFVRTVAAALGLDPDATVARMLAEPVVEESAGYAPPMAVPRVLLGLAAVLVLALAVGLVRIVASGEGAGASGSDAEVVHRVDPVRALAESQAGVAAGTPGAVAAPPPERPRAASGVTRRASRGTAGD